MAIEGVKRTNFTPKPTETEKPKTTVKPAVIQNTDNRDSVVGAVKSAENLVKFKMNSLLDGVFAAKTPAAPKPAIDPVKKADELINSRGGVSNISDDGAHDVGKDIADLAKTDPDGAVAVMNQVQTKLKDTTRGDNVASGFSANTTDTDLQSVARAKGGVEMLKGLQDHLLSGSVHDDEIKDAARFGKAVTSAAGLFTDKGDGIGPAQANYVSPYNEKATPEEAASFLKYDTAFNTPGSKSQAFAEALELHKNDPAWTKDFLSAVGTKKVAEYTSGIYQIPYANKELIDKYSNTVRSTLEGLVKSGDLKQEGMNSLVDQLKNRNPYVFSEIFGKSTDANFKQSFVDSAIANGDDRLDAAASYVLSGMSSDRQSQTLTNLDKNGKLDSFIKGAMAGQQEMVTLDYHLKNPEGSYADAPKMKLGGVTQLLQNAGIQTGYNGSSLQQAPFSKELQEKLFYAAAKGLTDSKAAANFKSDVAFKDAISNVFLQHFDDIFKNSISPNGSSLNNDTKWLGSFFQNTMFSQPPGTKASDVLATVYTRMAGVAKATDLINSGKSLSKDEQALVDQYKQWSPLGANWKSGQAAGVVGEWLGNFDRAYTNAVKEIKGDAAANKSLLDVFVGGIDKAIGLANLSPGGGIVKDLLVDQLKKLPSYLEGKQVEGNTAKLENSANIITDLNNAIWDTIFYQNKSDYSNSFEFIAGHKPTENGLK
jgi:hypothetical protein